MTQRGERADSTGSRIDCWGHMPARLEQRRIRPLSNPFVVPAGCVLLLAIACVDRNTGASGPFDFRERSGAYVGAQATYAVEANRDGAFALAASIPATIRGSALTFETESLSRGSELITGAVSTRVAKDGRLEVRRGPVTERLQMRESGVEQTWSFESAPGGRGDLTVRVRTSGQRFVRETQRGLHFADKRTGRGFLYGRATWVDASGTQTRLASAFRDDSIFITVPERVLESSSWPAILDPIISPEISVDTPASGPASESQYLPAISSDGTDYLVVWSDLREDFGSEIYGALVSSDGTVLSPYGIPISTGPGSHGAPGVAFDGTNHLVVWHSRRDGLVNVYAARITPAGVVLDPTGILVESGAPSGVDPRVAYGAGHFLVVWATEEGATLEGKRVSPSGTVLDPTPLTLAAGSDPFEEPAVSFDGTNFVLVWQATIEDSSDLYWVRVSPDGMVVDSQIIPIATGVEDHTTPVVSCRESQPIPSDPACLVSWLRITDRRDSDVMGARITRSGTVLDPGGIILDSERASEFIRPSVAARATDFLVTWVDLRNGDFDIYGTRVDADGTVLDPVGIEICCATGDQMSPAVASNGSDFLVVWEDLRAGLAFGLEDVYGARVSGSGAVVDVGGKPIALGSSGQHVPVVAQVGAGSLVAWQDHRNGAPDIRVGRLDGAGNYEPASTTAASGSRSHLTPRLACGVANCLLVWVEEGLSFSGVLARLLNPDGTMIDQQPILIASGALWSDGVDVAFDGTNYFVVWSEGTRIAAVVVDPSGEIRNPGSFEISSTVFASEPRVSCAGTNCLVAWAGMGGSGFLEILAARVDTSGPVVDPSLLVVDATDVPRSPSVATNSRDFIVTWTDDRNIHGARVTGSGTVLDTPSIPIRTGIAVPSSPSMTWAGTYWLLGWSERRNERHEVYATRLGVDGRLLDKMPLSIASGLTSNLNPEVAPAGPDRFLVAWEHFDPALSTRRVMARFVEYEPQPGGTPDAGETSDAGTADEDMGPLHAQVGCGCGAGGPWSLLPALLILGALSGSRRASRYLEPPLRE